MTNWMSLPTWFPWRPVRLMAQALDQALHGAVWEAAAEVRFQMPVHFADFATFDTCMMQPTYADHQIDAPTRVAIQQRFDSHLGPDGAHLTRPMHVRLLRKRA